MTEERLTNSLSIPKLLDDGSNWVEYQIKAETAMGAQSLELHIDGTAHKPSPYAADAKGTPVLADGKTEASEDQIEAREKRIETFNKRQFLAKHMLLTSVSPRLSTLIMPLKTAKEMWDEIKKDATKKSKLCQVDTRRRLQESRCEEGDDMPTHLNKLVHLRNELDGMGASIPDEDFTTILLGSFPPSYRTLLSTITISAQLAGNTIPSTDVIRIVTEEAAHRAIATRNDQAAGGAALMATAKKGKKGKGKPRKPVNTNLKCSNPNCERIGHTTDQCYQKGGGKEGQGPWQKAAKAAKAANATTASASSAEVNYALTCTTDVLLPAVANPATSQSATILVDSGASTHFCPDRSKFTSFVHDDTIVTTAEGRTFKASGRGDITLYLPNGESYTKVTLKEAIYAPKMPFTLVSISRVDKVGCEVIFKDGKCRIIAADRKTIAVIPSINGLYQMGPKDGQLSGTYANVATKMSLMDAHRTMGHVSLGAVKHAIKTGVTTGIELTDDKEELCEACAKAKPTRKPFSIAAQNRAKQYGERIHADLWGPAAVKSLGGALYSADFTDDATRFTHIEFIKSKKDVLAVYQKLDAQIQTQTHTVIKYLRTDNGGEFKSNIFDAHLAKRGTARELTVHHTHEQVGVAERYNRHKADLCRAMLIDSGLPRYLWADAMNHATWIKNRMPTQALEGRSPFQARFKHSPDLSTLIPFGTHTWVKLYKPGKLNPQAKEGRFVGFDKECRGYKIYYPDTRTVNIEREVTFDKAKLTYDDSTIPLPVDDSPEGENNIKISQIVSKPPEQPKSPRNETPEIPKDTSTATPPIYEPPKEIPINPQPNRDGLIDPGPEYGRSQRQRHAPGFYKSYNEGKVNSAIAYEAPQQNEQKPTDPDINMAHLIQYAMATAAGPGTLKEALAGPHAKEWATANEDEISMLKRLGTWKLVPRPKDSPVIPTHPILRLKTGSNGEILRRKVRWVAGGHRQTKGVNFEETFAAAAKISSIRVILALAASWDWDIDQIDVVGAYLNAELEEEVYMEVPHGVLTEKDGDKVAKLLKGMYGLKQSGRIWHRKLTGIFSELGFERSAIDHSMFYRSRDGERLLIPVSTDDMVVAGNSRKSIDQFKSELGRYLEITDLGEIRWLLGFEVRRQRSERTISINQCAYIESIASRFQLLDSKPIHTPIDPGTILDASQCPDKAIEHPYREACGSVLWPAIISRPDVSFAIGLLTQFMQNPSEEHWKAIRRVIKYLHTTKNLWLTFGGPNAQILGFTDADWASQAHRHSISGFAFKIGCGAVTWSSRKQSIVALSTAEAEYVAAAHSTKEALWFREFLGEFSDVVKGPIDLNCDNQATIALSKDNKFHSRTKHISIRHHFIREAVENEHIAVHYVPSSENVADVFTKALPRPKFEYFVERLGLRTA